MTRRHILAIAFASAIVPCSMLRTQQVDSLSLRAHARFLSSDALAGRSNGTPGQHAAAEYIVAQFERLGLEALNSTRTFRQPIPLTRVLMDREAAALVWTSGRESGEIAGDRFHHAGGDSVAFLPFDGPALTLSEYHRAVADVAGRVVVIGRTGGVPLDSISLALESAGARALIVMAPDTLRYRALRHARGPHRFVVRARTGSGADRRMPVLIADPRVAPVLARVDRIRLRASATFEPVVAWNLIARLRGTRAPAHDRPIIFMAHYDHIGVGAPRGGDSVYNGFMDNAVGVAAVLGVAEALRSRPLPVSALFLLTAVEEEGSLGGAYFTSYPPIPLATLTAVVNLDAGAPLAPPTDWYVEGGADPTIAVALRRLATQGTTTRPMPLTPNSDHWPFHVRGVPAAFPVSGDTWGTMTSEETDRAVARWWRQHQPDDAWRPDFPLSGLQAYATFALKLGEALAAVAAR